MFTIIFSQHKPIALCKPFIHILIVCIAIGLGTLYPQPSTANEIDDYNTKQTIQNTITDNIEFDTSNLIISVKNGIVRLSGRLSSNEELTTIVETIYAVEEVQGLHLDLFNLDNPSESPQKTLERIQKENNSHD